MRTMMNAEEKSVWNALVGAVNDAIGVWGEPARLAAQGVFPRGEAQLLRRWLASLEASARAMLTVMALKLVPGLASRSPSSRAKRATPAKAASPAARAQGEAPAEVLGSARDDGPGPGDSPGADGAAPPSDETAAPAPPGAQSVASSRFQLAPGARKAAARRKTRKKAGPGARKGFVRTAALARRFAALIRAVENPEPHARRLARILAADRYAAARVLARPADDGQSYVLYGDVVDDAFALAWAALRAPPPAQDTG